MPIYEYECGACGHQVEAFQKMSDAPLTECPTCHRPALGKVMSATSFQLKGSGWYASGYSKTKEAPASDSTGTDGSTTTKKSNDNAAD